MSHQYIFAIVKKVLNSQNKDIIGDDSILVLDQIFTSLSLELFSVPSSLRDVVKEGDFIVADYPTKEITKVIRDTTREQIDNIYKDLAQQMERATKKGEGAGRVES